LPAIWALGELGTAHALELLLPLAWSPRPAIQQAAIRCLIELENKKQIPPAVLEQVKWLLADLRAKTDWII
jgi:HEAT repeat protein